MKLICCRVWTARSYRLDLTGCFFKQKTTLLIKSQFLHRVLFCTAFGFRCCRSTKEQKLIHSFDTLWIRVQSIIVTGKKPVVVPDTSNTHWLHTTIRILFKNREGRNMANSLGNLKKIWASWFIIIILSRKVVWFPKWGPQPNWGPTRGRWVTWKNVNIILFYFTASFSMVVCVVFSCVFLTPDSRYVAVGILGIFLPLFDLELQISLSMINSRCSCSRPNYVSSQRSSIHIF